MGLKLGRLVGVAGRRETEHPAAALRRHRRFRSSRRDPAAATRFTG
jgi:hypothetical protein